jgi:rhamnogalacturonyl hydrolase YesR/AraC-like DNA-binding protein
MSAPVCPVDEEVHVLPPSRRDVRQQRDPARVRNLPPRRFRGTLTVDLSRRTVEFPYRNGDGMDEVAYGRNRPEAHRDRMIRPDPSTTSPQHPCRTESEPRSTARAKAELDDLLCNTVIDPDGMVEEWHSSAWDLADMSGWMHTICCVARGNGEITVNGERHPAQPESLFYLAPGERFSAVPLPSHELVIYSCRFRVLSSRSFRLLEPPVCTRVRDPQLLLSLRKLVNASRDGDRARFPAWLFIYNVLGYWRSEGLLRLSPSKRQQALVTLERVCSFMNANLDGAITMDSLARLACREKSFLYRLFREHLQTTPMRYFRHLQMMRAKQLLLEGRTLKEIAAGFGYSDAFSFSKAFKKCFGVSPGLLWARSSRPERDVHRADDEPSTSLANLWGLHPSLPLLRRRVMHWNPSKTRMDWEGCLGAQGMIICGKEFADADMLAWSTAWANYHLAVPVRRVEPDSPAWHTDGQATQGLVLTGYSGSWAAPLALAPLYEATKSVTYARAIAATAEYVITRALRTADGAIVHGGFTHNVWVDTPCFSASALAHSYAITGAKEHAREAIAQCLLHARYLRDERTGCFVHDADVEKGLRSRSLWARGNGFILLAIADTLAACPRATAGYGDLAAMFVDLAEGLARFQHESGLWRIILDDPDSHLETSGSAMILTGMAIGMRREWLARRMETPILRGFRELLTWIHPESGRLQGAFMGSEKPAGPGGWNRHKYIEMGECTYATGMFLRLLAEMKRLGIIARP